MESTSGDWSRDLQITHNNMQSVYPDAAFDDQGYLHVVWADSKTGNFEIHYKKLDSRGRTLFELQVSDTPTRSYLPDIELDRFGTAHVAWMDNCDGNWEVYYRKVSTWDGSMSTTRKLTDTPISPGTYRPRIAEESSTQTLVDPGDLSSLRPSISVDPRGYTHLVWTDLSEGNYEVFYSLVDRGDNPVVDRARITHSQTDSINPLVYATTWGGAYITWIEQDVFDQVQMISVSEEGKVSQQAICLVEAPGEILETRASLTEDRVLDLAWTIAGKGIVSPKNSDIFYQRLDVSGRALTESKKMTYGLTWPESPYVSTSDDDSIDMIWQDGNKNRLQTDLYYVRMDSVTNTQVMGGRLTISPGISTTPVLDRHGDSIAAVWADSRDGNLEIYMKVYQPPVDIVLTKDIEVEGASFALLALTSFGMLSTIGYLGGTEVGRTSLIIPIFPLYSRLSRDKLLDHGTRGEIYQLIEDKPGITYTEIKDFLALKNGSLSHHLITLEKGQLIQSRRDGSYRRYYPFDMVDLPTEIQIGIVRAINMYPGISQTEIAKLLNTSRQVINYHIGLLYDSGKINIKHAGRRTELYLRNCEICA